MVRQHLFSRLPRIATIICAAVLWPLFATAPAAAFPITSRVTVPAGVEIRALYLTGSSAGSIKGRRLVEHWRRLGGNAVVFDIKDWDGDVSFNSKLALAHPNAYTPIKNLPEWVAWLHTHGLYVIARIATFKDQQLAEHHPELAVQKRGGGVWLRKGKPAWLDPSLPAVQNYALGLAREAAAAGVDEIQFDYIRFPVGGDQKNCVFYYQRRHPRWQRTDVISGFLHRARLQLHPQGVHISIDVFGITAWARPVDVLATGQDIVALSYQADVICPMIYPSHFFHHFDHLADPADQPHLLIAHALTRFNDITADTGVVIRPWLQAFGWHTRDFNSAYVATQVEAARQLHAVGFMFWNAENRYPQAETAMREMSAAPAGKYFLGGFVYPISAAAKPAQKVARRATGFSRGAASAPGK